MVLGVRSHRLEMFGSVSTFWQRLRLEGQRWQLHPLAWAWSRSDRCTRADDPQPGSFGFRSRTDQLVSARGRREDRFGNAMAERWLSWGTK